MPSVPRGSATAGERSRPSPRPIPTASSRVRRHGGRSRQPHAPPGSDTSFPRVKSHPSVLSRDPRISRNSQESDLDVSRAGGVIPQTAARGSSSVSERHPGLSRGNSAGSAQLSRLNKIFLEIRRLCLVNLTQLTSHLSYKTEETEHVMLLTIFPAGQSCSWESRPECRPVVLAPQA